MPSITHRRVTVLATVLAMVSTLALIAFSADAFAKSSRSRSRPAAAATSAAVQSTPTTGYYYPQGRAIPPYPTGITGRGNALDNTAGWGDVGAR
jgi:hypothetical protein